MEDEERSEQLEGTVESGAPRNTTEEERLASLAESIHIHLPPMATTTETREQIIKEPVSYFRREMTGEIHLHMGHQIVNIVNNEAALRHATGPD